MAVATFDTLKFANTLKAAGVPPQQAEAQATAFAEVIQLNLKDLVTKDDLARELKESEQRLTARIDRVEAKLGGDITLLRWMLGAVFAMNVAGVGLLARILFRLP